MEKKQNYENGKKIETLTWTEFMKTVKYEQYSFERFNVFMLRCFLIKKVKELFIAEIHFSDMSADGRKFIAGTPNKFETAEMRNMLKNAGKTVESNGKVRYEPTTNRLVTASTYIGAFFGSMAGSGAFKHAIIENNENISLALDQIPLTGEVTKQHYSNFWKYYGKEFSETSIATATRLLCMKRPDIFICFDSANKKILCNAFNFSVSKRFTKNDYWDDILLQIFESSWYKSPKENFENDEEKLVYGARVAFLDAMYYELTTENENKTRGKNP